MKNTRVGYRVQPWKISTQDRSFTGLGSKYTASLNVRLGLHRNRLRLIQLFTFFLYYLMHNNNKFLQENQRLRRSNNDDCTYRSIINFTNYGNF